MGALCLMAFLAMSAPEWLVMPGTHEDRANAVAAEQNKIPFPMPKSHKGNWLEYHGKAADPGLNRNNPCLACHEKNDCITCHNTRLPKDHTTAWRTTSHGFMAEGNRDRCSICHKQDFCVRCHNETAPRTHKGNWASTHCGWCHFSGTLAPDDNCVVCHKQAPHTSAPHNVSGQLNCSQCH